METSYIAPMHALAHTYICMCVKLILMMLQRQTRKYKISVFESHYIFITTTQQIHQSINYIVFARLILTVNKLV